MPSLTQKLVRAASIMKAKKTRLPLAQVYQKMAQFPMATLEKFTLQTAAPANVREESKILRAAAEIRKHNTSTRIMFCACPPTPRRQPRGLCCLR